MSPYTSPAATIARATARAEEGRRGGRGGGGGGGGGFDYTYAPWVEMDSKEGVHKGDQKISPMNKIKIKTAMCDATMHVARESVTESSTNFISSDILSIFFCELNLSFFGVLCTLS